MIKVHVHNNIGIALWIRFLNVNINAILIMVQTVTVYPQVVFGDPSRFVFIGGPCVIESESSVLRHAEKISAICRDLGIPYVFKASFDKANRSSSKSFRGPGLEAGLKILSRVKKEFGIGLHLCISILGSRDDSHFISLARTFRSHHY